MSFHIPILVFDKLYEIDLQKLVHLFGLFAEIFEKMRRLGAAVTQHKPNTFACVDPPPQWPPVKHQFDRHFVAFQPVPMFQPLKELILANQIKSGE